jgi:4-hydroxy-tetrahydrodipicolinate synthase
MRYDERAGEDRDTFFGVWPIVFTPFLSDGSIDHEGLMQLTEFYVSQGVSGVFALGLSSEVFELKLAERLHAVRTIVETVNGRIPVMAMGNFGSNLGKQAVSLERIYNQGVDAVIIGLSLLPKKDSLGEQLLQLNSWLDVPMGLYECPIPEHRLIPSRDLRQVAVNGNFVFMKDTCRDNEVFEERCHICAGTPLRLFQANLSCLPGSLDVGASGFCGIIGGIAPRLCRDVCDIGKLPSTVRKDTHNLLMHLQELVVTRAYPASAKYVLKRMGLNISCFDRRNGYGNLTLEQRQKIDRLITENNIM